MSKPTYEELVDLVNRIWKTSRVESDIGVEWVNYPVEIFEELAETITNLELPDDPRL